MTETAIQALPEKESFIKFFNAEADSDTVFESAVRVEKEHVEYCLAKEI